MFFYHLLYSVREGIGKGSWVTKLFRTSCFSCKFLFDAILSCYCSSQQFGKGPGLRNCTFNSRLLIDRCVYNLYNLYNLQYILDWDGFIKCGPHPLFVALRKLWKVIYGDQLTSKVGEWRHIKAWEFMGPGCYGTEVGALLLQKGNLVKDFIDNCFSEQAVIKDSKTITVQ